MKNLICLMAVLALLTLAPMANASMQLSYSVNGGPATVCPAGTGPSAGPVTCVTPNPPGILTVGSVTITSFSALSNSPGTAANSNEFDSTLQIANNGTATATVILWTTAQDFTSPTAPPGLSWSNEESLDGTTGTTTGQAIDCADPTNALAPPGTATFCSSVGALKNTNIPETINGAASASNTNTISVASLSKPYSLSSQITLILSPGATMHFEDSQILTPVPEPTSVLLLGGVLLGVTSLVRKKIAKRT